MFFYFDVNDRGDVLRDQHGIRLPSVSEAKEQAFAIAQQLLIDASSDADEQYFAVAIRNAKDAHVFQVTLTLRGTADDQRPEWSRISPTVEDCPAIASQDERNG